MAVGRMARRVAALVVAGLVCGVGLADTGRAQGSDEFAGQRGEVNRLVNEEKHAEALAAGGGRLVVLEHRLHLQLQRAGDLGPGARQRARCETI